ncbi:MAG: hypothetical protein K8R59_06240 [Thermoanaerobaculales bacterium]|nr:hypothetical protein [Thermoanaerobaculales bacterium]
MEDLDLFGGAHYDRLRWLFTILSAAQSNSGSSAGPRVRGNSDVPRNISPEGGEGHKSRRFNLGAWMPHRLAAVFVFVAVGAITLLRLNVVNRLFDQGWFAKYPALAEEIVRGSWPVDRMADISPGYLGFIFLLTGPAGLDPQGIRTLQIILVSVAAVVCAVAALRLWGPWPALATVVAFLGSRAALVNASELEPETLILLLTSLGFAVIFTSEGWKGRTLGGLFFGMAAATRPSILLPLILLGTALWVRERGTPRGILVLALGAGAALPMIVSQTIVAGVLGTSAPAMNPGTVLFEGWNAMTSGYQGEAPAIVKDLEHVLALPDGLHVAYRVVAGRALQVEPTPEISNSYWAKRAFSFVRHQPAAAFRLMARKAVLAFHSYDAWDLATMERKDRELSLQVLWLPFGLAAGLAALGWAFGRQRHEAAVLAFWVGGVWLVMILFYVTSRQRNVMLPAIALLVGLAVHEVMKRWNQGERRTVVLSITAAVVGGVVFGVNASPQREDHHTWTLRFAQEEAARRMNDARMEGDEEGERFWSVQSVIFLNLGAKASSAAVEEAVRRELAEAPPPERVFDLALVLAHLGRWQAAGELFAGLDADGYRPWRGTRVTSSIDYHRACCFLALGDTRSALRALDRSVRATGDARVLALASVVEEVEGNTETAQSIQERLFDLNDPYTARLALADAHALAGQAERAGRLRLPVIEDFSEFGVAES